jgi:hypothetical protein
LDCLDSQHRQHDGWPDAQQGWIARHLDPGRQARRRQGGELAARAERLSHRSACRAASPRCPAPRAAGRSVARSPASRPGALGHRANLSIFQASAGRLLQRIAAPASRRWSAFRSSWAGIGWTITRARPRAKASELVSLSFAKTSSDSLGRPQWCRRPEAVDPPATIRQGSVCGGGLSAGWGAFVVVIPCGRVRDYAAWRK